MLSLTLIIFISIYIFSSYLHTALSQKEAIKTSDAVASQIHASMYQLMRKGWSREEMKDFMESIKHSFENSSNEINIYRGENVEELFGKIPQRPFDRDIVQAFLDGQKKVIEHNGFITTLMPMVSKDECLSCHTNANENTVLGVIEIKYNLAAMTKETERNYWYFFLAALPFILLITFLLSKHVRNKLNKSIIGFAKKVDAVNTVKDFRNLDITDTDLGFSELNDILHNVNLLSEKLKKTAVDKELLEFEIRIFDKFIITSNIVKDWREYIKDLLLEINTVMDAYSLITMFRVGDDSYEIEVFWKNIPSEKTIKLMEEIAQKEMAKSPYFDNGVQYQITHNIADKNKQLLELTHEEIEMQTKSLFLETPKIGGIVGISVQSLLVKDPIRHIVIDGILTTLINIVGSVKAIHKYTEDLEYYATKDPLTTFYNQRVFRDILENEIVRADRHSYSFGLFVIDCDNFKIINDRYGHSFGDKYLQAFASTLELAKRPEDVAARYGGDEFALIIPECDEKEAREVAKSIQSAIEALKIQTEQKAQVQATASIGAAMYPSHAKTGKELFNIADAMMYRSKRSGKNAITFPEQNDILKVFKETEEKTILVLDAIKHNKIVPHFQPIAKIENSQINIHELLMRIEIENNLISAGEFIEIAENMGVINSMDYIVIELAFKEINKTNYDGILFVNLSPKSLIVGEFIDKINGLANKYKIDKSKIVFEITERETVKNFVLLEKFVQNLKLQGFSFAIDDFGSGFSTFHYIKKFPIDYIKIDGEFIINIDKDEKDMAFVKSIVSLAKELGVKTVAEYVENKETIEHLKNMGVDFAQGYYIGRPSSSFRK